MKSIEATLPVQCLLAMPELESGVASAADCQFLKSARWLAEMWGLELAVLVPRDQANSNVWSAADCIVSTEGTPSQWTMTRRLAALRAVLGNDGIRHVVLSERPISSDVARQAAQLPEAEIACSVISCAEHSVVCLSGSGRQEYTLATVPRLLVLDIEFAMRSNSVAKSQRRIELTIGHGVSPIREVGVVEQSSKDRSVADADFIIAAGNGIADWDGFRRLASELSASQGASRPVCDRGIISRERQIGSSGALASASCYVAFGISGAIQHLEGIVDCEHIAAVNVDPLAPIHGYSELSVIGDADAVVDALLNLLGKVST